MRAIDFLVAQHRTRSPQLPGANLPWLAQLRGRALERFAAEGWPTTRRDDWRHTSLAFLEQLELGAGSATAAATDVAAALAALRAGAEGEHWLVFVDGRLAPALSALGSLPAGVRIASLADAFAHEAEAVEAAFGRAEDGDTPAALNAAFAADGAFVRLARGVALDAPLHLVFIGHADGHRHLRNLVVAEAGAEATIVEHYPATAGQEEAMLTTAVTRILAGADARVTHLKLQQEAAQAIHLATIEAEQARGAAFASHSLSFGARLARNDIRTRFDGEGCETLFNGLYHADGRRHVDHHTRIDHVRPRGTSREYYRGLLDGNARGVFAGRIVVAEDAQKSDALQRCDNLLLSKLAEADARPELEIYADDVKCAHGATVGQLDEDSLFYLRTRGLDEVHARQLLTYAFAAEALQRIAHAPLRRLGRAALLARLPGADRLEELL